jgi:F0F1-type ATP synthase epsilon subunit
MRLIIRTAEKVLLDRDDLGHIRAPLGDGSSIGIRDGHHPLIGEIGQGKVLFGIEEYEDETSVEPGIIQVENDLVSIFTSGLLDTEDSDPDRKKPTQLSRLTEDLYRNYGHPG